MTAQLRYVHEITEKDDNVLVLVLGMSSVPGRFRVPLTLTMQIMVLPFQNLGFYFAGFNTELQPLMEAYTLASNALDTYTSSDSLKLPSHDFPMIQRAHACSTT